MKKDESSRKEWLVPILSIVGALVLAGGVYQAVHTKDATQPQAQNQTGFTQVGGSNVNAASAVLDPGSSLHGRPAPNFTLTDQFGKKVSLSDFRGKTVVLAFVDSECTTICPLTTESMMRAMKMIGPKAAKNVQLLGINANPQATKISDVLQYSKDHNMLHAWDFLTGSDSQLKAMWKSYYIYDGIINGQIDHTPALYIIGPNGKEQYVYMTPSQYGAVDSQASIIAHEISKLLPASVRPTLKSIPYHVPDFGPTSDVSLPLVNGSGSVKIGPAHPQLLTFFASWAPDAKKDLQALDTYAGSPGAPQVVAVDVATTEPGNKLNPAFLTAISPKNYPVAVDNTGQLTDAYKVTDLMWFALTDGKGHIIWSHDGWLPTQQLKVKVQAMLKKIQ